jgi:hypothetical protein
MKNILLKILGVFLFTALAVTTSYAQGTGASATANASATLITPIGISVTSDMDFGIVAEDAGTAGTVQLATGGGRTAGGGATLVSGGTPSAAVFAVTGEANYTYSISLPSSIDLSDGASHTMTVNSFVSSPTPTGTLDGTGNETLSVGATLNIASGQAAGTYTNASDLTVTVNYN